MQLGVFSPIFRAHGFRRAEIEKRFWLFDKPSFAAMRSALLLRIEWLPHLYSAARRAHDGGPSPVRPLYYAWPLQPAAYARPSHFLFGSSDVVVAPVTRRGEPDVPLTRGVALWVPPGEWFQLHSGARLWGPASLLQSFALDEIPVLVVRAE